MSRNEWAVWLAGLAVILAFFAVLDLLVGKFTAAAIVGSVAAISALALLAMAASR